MSSHTVRSFMSLSRLSISAFGPHGSVSRVAYSTAFVKNQSGRKGQRSRGKDALTRRTKRVPVAPRAEKMSVDQDWTSVYPAAAAYKPSAVPLPVRMGFPVKGGAPPEKWGNLELIKIPNFLHLTPNAIKKHCKALEPFCTKWPAALDTDAKCDQFFPVKVKTTDHVSAGLSIRNPSARIVELRVKLSSLNLDDHARKKMVKLAGEKYCSDSDVLTITTDRCPLRQQNQDYAMYLLTVLYHESWKTEAWEADKTVADMEEYHWEDSPSQRNILDTLVRMRSAGEGEEVREQLLGRSEVQQYKDSVTRLKNEGENEDTVLQYKEAVKKVLSL